MSDEINENKSENTDDIEFEPLKGSEKKAAENADDDTDEFIPDDGEGNIPSTKDTVKDLRDKLKKAIAEKQEYLDGWQRAKADFVNARKRDEEIQKQIIKFASEDIIMQLIPVLDSFTMAFANKDAWEKVDKNWRVGVEYIYSQLIGILEQNGFKAIDPKGLKFDPIRDHAIETVEVTDPSEDNMVVEVLKKGYELNGKIVSPANVKIGEYKKNA